MNTKMSIRIEIIILTTSLSNSFPVTYQVKSFVSAACRGSIDHNEIYKIAYPWLLNENLNTINREVFCHSRKSRHSSFSIHTTLWTRVIPWKCARALSQSFCRCQNPVHRFYGMTVISRTISRASALERMGFGRLSENH